VGALGNRKERRKEKRRKIWGNREAGAIEATKERVEH